MTWTALEEYDDNGTIYYTPPGEGLDSNGEPDSKRGVKLTAGRAYQCCIKRGSRPFPVVVSRVPGAYPSRGGLVLIRREYGVDWTTPIDSGLELALTIEEYNEESREE